MKSNMTQLHYHTVLPVGYDEKWLPDIRKYTFLMPSVFGGTCRCEQLYSLVKNVKSRTRKRLTDERLVGCTRIPTEIKHDIEKITQSKSIFKYLTITHFC
jgi:hypothetical protein